MIKARSIVRDHVVVLVLNLIISHRPRVSNQLQDFEPLMCLGRQVTGAPLRVGWTPARMQWLEISSNLYMP